MHPVASASFCATSRGAPPVPVVYRGTVPDQFKVGRELMVKGALRNGVFVAERDSMVTKCPSKYEPKSST